MMTVTRITSYNVCYTKLLRGDIARALHRPDYADRVPPPEGHENKGARLQRQARRNAVVEGPRQGQRQENLHPARFAIDRCGGCGMRGRHRIECSQSLPVRHTEARAIERSRRQA